MLPFVIAQLNYVLRILLAGACGIAIGYERRNRKKEAGIRTHFIVAIGSALFMVVSKYGFQDQMHWSNLTLDPSRIAAQVATGIGFLGAGIIFTHDETIKGLTTAAGIWTTAAIGLTVGAGLYIAGVLATAVMIAGQVLLHGKIKWLSTPKMETLHLELVNDRTAIQNIREYLEKQDISIVKFKSTTKTSPQPLIDIIMVIKVPELFDTVNLMFALQDNPNVKFVEI